MQPRIDLSKNSRFTIWEAGGWNESKGFGSGLVVAGPNGEKLPVIYDINPRANLHQCCFVAEVGQVLVEAYIKKADTPIDGRDLIVSLEIARIESITTQLVQGNAQPKVNLKTLWVHRAMATAKTAEAISDDYAADADFYKEEFHDLLELVIEKALTKPNSQRIFWGIPRATSTQQD